MTQDFRTDFIKILSANDVGITNSHQAGFLIPKRIAKMNYFPELPFTEFNPRVKMDFFIMDVNETISCNYIFYNGKKLEKSSRDEYRLTGLTSFIRSNSLKVGDQIAFGRYREFRALKKMPLDAEILASSTEQKEHENSNSTFITVNGWKVRERN